MTLDEYLTKFSIPKGQFAKRLRMRPSRLSHLLAGLRDGSGPSTRKASGRECALIERETGGRVTFRDMRSDWFKGIPASSKPTPPKVKK